MGWNFENFSEQHTSYQILTSMQWYGIGILKVIEVCT
jgi:hypothetical protein